MRRIILRVIRKVKLLAQVKTGVSLDAELFESAELLARELQLSRSGLYARALRAFIEQQRSQDLLDGLNAAYGGPPDPEDEALLRGVRRTMRRVGDPWE